LAARLNRPVSLKETWITHYLGCGRSQRYEIGVIGGFISLLWKIEIPGQLNTSLILYQICKYRF
ncbi:MAG: hypothetical protein JXB88_18250, partial [Spirochaetales bacterium]|nr:hypothetical protein [Spirochaetales bacterium]